MHSQPNNEKEKIVREPKSLKNQVPFRFSRNNIRRDCSERPTKSGTVRLNVFKCELITTALVQSFAPSRVHSRMDPGAIRKMVESLRGKTLELLVGLIRRPEASSACVEPRGCRKG